MPDHESNLDDSLNMLLFDDRERLGRLIKERKEIRREKSEDGLGDLEGDNGQPGEDKRVGQQV